MSVYHGSSSSPSLSAPSPASSPPLIEPLLGHIIQDLANSNNLQQIKEAVQSVKLTEYQVASVFPVLIRTPSLISPLLDIIRDVAPRVDWKLVLSELSSLSGGVRVDNNEELREAAIMVEIYKYAVLGPQPTQNALSNFHFPVEPLLQCWSNPSLHSSVVRLLLPSVLTLFTALPDEEGNNITSITQNYVNSPKNLQGWISIDLLEHGDKSPSGVSPLRSLLPLVLERAPKFIKTGIVSRSEGLTAILLPAHITISNNAAVPTNVNKLWESHSRQVLNAVGRSWFEVNESSGNGPSSPLTPLFHSLSHSFRSTFDHLLASHSQSIPIDLFTVRDKQSVRLNAWVSNKMSERDGSSAFLATSLTYIKHNMDNNNNANESLTPFKLSFEALAIFFKAFLSTSAAANSDLQNLYFQFTNHPDLKDIIGRVNSNIEVVAEESASSDIEKESNAYFHKLYSGALSLDAVIEMLRRLKSGNQREHEVYVCMIRNLLDEYRFFNKYPMKELNITGHLFGLLIQHKLLSDFTLGLALRFVLDALRKPMDTKLFSFGMWAISKFRARLQQWPQYAMHVYHIPHIQSAQPELAAYLQSVLKQHSDGDARLPPGLTQDENEDYDFSAQGSSSFSQGFSMDAQTFSTNLPAFMDAEKQAAPSMSSPPSTALPPPGLGSKPDVKSSPQSDAKNANAAGTFGFSVNIDSLLAEGDLPLPLAPSEATKDKIHFIINNVTKLNLRSKGRELKAVLKPEYVPYFARYLVIKRVSIEANFQRLYAAFLDYVAIPELKKWMLETTYYNIQVLLKNDKIVSSSSERSLLKNLGSWLGLLTIAKNKPIRAKYLDLKTLVLEAYDTGRLIAVIPFTAKVLEACAESKVFKAPNPWLMAIVALLREIFELSGLKLNLKFEIEVLFNHLQISMKDVKSSQLLRDRSGSEKNLRPEQAAKPAMSNPTFGSLLPMPLSTLPPVASKKQAGALGRLSGRSPSPSLLAGEDDASLLSGLQNSSAFNQPNRAASSPSTNEQLLVPNLSQYVVINPSIQLFQMYAALKRLVPTAIDRAIREIINPVVERSLAIACVTTRELILKDFSMEQDENKMRSAAHSMVSNLTSSLALVTAREPLRVSINNHLNQLLEQNTTGADRALIERACSQVSSDNLELCSSLIEKGAAERACREIDEQLLPVYNMRRKHRETTGQPFIDPSYFNQQNNRYVASLPDALRPKPGTGLSTAQLRVYEDFSRVRLQHAAAAAAAPQSQDRASNKPEGAAPAGVGPTPTATGIQSVQPNPLRTEEDKKRQPSPSPFPQGGVAPSQFPPRTDAAARPLVGGGTTPNAPGLPGTSSANRSPTLTATPQPSNLTAQQTLDKLLGYLATLEQAVLRFPNHKSIPLHSLSQAVTTAGREDQEINVLMRMMATLLQQTARDEQAYPKDLVGLTFALKCFKRLYERENRSSLLQIDVHIGVLKCIRAVCPKLVQELTAWLLCADDDRKFILPITAGLLRARLLNTPDLDIFLSKLATSIFSSGQAVGTAAAPPNTPQQQPQQVLNPQMDFILTLVRRVVVKRPILQVSELGQLLETLNKIGQQASSQPRLKLLSESIAHLLEDVRAAAIVAEKERSEQERAARLGEDGKLSDPNAPNSLLAAAPANLGMLPPSVASLPNLATGPSNNLSLNSSSFLEGEESDNFDRMTELENAAIAVQDPMEQQQYKQQIEYLLGEWMNICLTSSDKAYSAYLSLLQQQRLLATPDSTARFFRCIIQSCVDLSLTSLALPPADNPNAPYTAIDALAKLFVFLLKFLDPSSVVGPNGQPINPAASTASKIILLRSFLSAIAYVLKKDHDQHTKQGQMSIPPPATPSFNQRPYLRLFNNLLHDLNTPDPLLDSNNVEVLACFAQIFRLLRPQKFIGFTFAWIELIGHRMFMSKLLISKQLGCSILFARLLIDLLRFLQPYLRHADLTDSIRLAYKGTLRLLLVLLHDFPEFLCEFHFSFCDVIPPSCIQMRNLVLSAFPRSMRLPDPFTPNLKVDLLPEMTQSPRIQSDITMVLSQPQHRTLLLLPLEHYLKYREPSNFLKQLLNCLSIQASLQASASVSVGPAIPTPQQLEAAHAAAVKRAGTIWNVPLINSVVMYVGLAGIANLMANQSKAGLVSQFQDSACMDVYETLLNGLDAEGRYYVLNAIANQLRFPNNHTHYFSCVLLYLFLQCKDEVIMEQITRVLLERLIVHRPHPWGLLITFIELIKNPRYDFWRQPFTRCAPEIERLFESVARSCMPPKTGQVGGQVLGSSVASPNQQGAQASAAGQAMQAHLQQEQQQQQQQQQMH